MAKYVIVIILMNLSQRENSNSEQGEVYWVNLGKPSDSGPGYWHPHKEKIDKVNSETIKEIIKGINLLIEPKDVQP